MTLPKRDKEQAALMRPRGGLEVCVCVCACVTAGVPVWNNLVLYHHPACVSDSFFAVSRSSPCSHLHHAAALNLSVFKQPLLPHDVILPNSLVLVNDLRAVSQKGSIAALQTHVLKRRWD